MRIFCLAEIECVGSGFVDWNARVAGRGSVE